LECFHFRLWRSAERKPWKNSWNERDDFIHVFFPELSGKKYWVTPLNIDARGAVRPYQYLSTAFNFDFKGRLAGFVVREPLKLADFWENGHPDISDNEDIAAYKEAGAKYALGDRETFRRDLPIEQLQHFLGKLKVLKVKFIDTSDERVDKLVALAFVRFTWEGQGNAICGRL
jgi:hypothetical protein